MTEASHVLKTSQPAISRLISDFERTLGLSLFERRHGRVTPTFEALRLSSVVEQSYLGIERIVQAAADLREFRQAQISVAAMPALCLDLVPETLGHYLADHPSARAAVHARSSRQVVQAVASGQADIGLATKPFDVSGVRCDAVVRVPYLCLLPENHPLAERDVIGPKDISEEPIITLTNSDTHDYLDRAFRDEGLVFRPRIETPLSVVAARHVELGLAVAIVDPYTVRYCSNRKVVERPFAPPIPFTFGILSPAVRAESSAVSRFREMLIDTLRDISSDTVELVQM